ADVLARLDVVATTNSEGADSGKGNKWTADLNRHFKDRRVVIIGDNDLLGRKHVQHVARNLHTIAETVRVLDLTRHWPGESTPEGADVADWIDQHDRDGSRLAALAKDAPPWEPGVEPVGADTDSASDDDALIAELAGLSALAYARRRKEAAKVLGIGVAD